MQSLADMYEHGRGVYKDYRKSQNWLWQATLQTSAGAMDILNTKSLIPLELHAMIQNLDHALPHLTYGQTMTLSGPNYASLLLVLLPTLASMNFCVPGFAATTPTCSTTGNLHPSTNTTTTSTTTTTTTSKVMLLGREKMIALCVRIQAMQRQGLYVQAVYGRRGIAKAATAQTHGETFRVVPNQLFVIPPTPTCDEYPITEQMLNWVQQANSYTPRAIMVHCVHTAAAAAAADTATAASSPSAKPACRECIGEALERLEAISHGSVALSLHEALDHRGQLAIWKNSYGKLKSETFKNYGRGDIDTMLAAMIAVQNNFDAQIACPLFIAQDPNLLWTTIMYHGTVRAALEYVAPHIDWTVELGPLQPAKQQRPIISTQDEFVEPGMVDKSYTSSIIEAGSILRKCGNDMCLNLELNRTTNCGFLTCQGCHRRSYCSDKCFQIDWPFHTRECNKKSSAGAPARTADPAVPNPSSNKTTTMPKMVGPPESGEEIVVYGLTSRPDLNGKIGIIVSGDLVEDRYPVQLMSCSQPQINVRPTNFYRLGVVEVKGKGKRRFKCARHDLDVCSICTMDFRSVNHIWKVYQETVYQETVSTTSSTTSSEIPSKAAIEHIAELNFATIATDDGYSSFTITTKQQQDDLPMVCHGISNPEKKFILKSLLMETKHNTTTTTTTTTTGGSHSSLKLSATIAAMACYGARSIQAARPDAILLLENFADKL